MSGNEWVKMIIMVLWLSIYFIDVIWCYFNCCEFSYFFIVNCIGKIKRIVLWIEWLICFKGNFLSVVGIKIDMCLVINFMV